METDVGLGDQGSQGGLAHRTVTHVAHAHTPSTISFVVLPTISVARRVQQPGRQVSGTVLRKQSLDLSTCNQLSLRLPGFLTIR